MKKIDKEKKIDFSMVSMDMPDTPFLPDKRPASNVGIYVPYGETNDYPDFLNVLYQNSAILSSIVNAMQDFVLGKGIDFSQDVKARLAFNTPREFRRFFKKIVFDKILTGGYAVKLIYNRNLSCCKIEWVDIRNLRLSIDGATAYFSETWNQGRRGELIRYTTYDAFTPGQDHNNPYACIYYNKGRSRGVYPVPSWQGAIKAVQTDCEINTFNLHSILHGMSASSIVNVPNGDSYSDEEKKQIERKFRANFAGSDNADSFILSFNPSPDDRVTIERIEDDSFADKFDLLQKSVVKNIFTAFRMAPQLAGYLAENIGFNTQEFAESFEIYNKTVVQPVQQDLRNDFDDLFEVQGSVLINPFSITTSDGDTIQN